MPETHFLFYQRPGAVVGGIQPSNSNFKSEFSTSNCSDISVYHMGK